LAYPTTNGDTFLSKSKFKFRFFRSLSIPLPELSEQKKVVEKIKAFRIETQKLETIYQNKVNDLEELKKSVLQKAFSGELKVSELGFDGLKDDRIIEKERKQILKSTHLKYETPRSYP